MINLGTGEAVARWKLGDLETKQQEYLKDIGEAEDYDWNDNVLNGIAYARDRDSFFITGKNWDKLFEV